MRFSLAALAVAIVALTATSCSDNTTGSVVFPPVGLQYTIAFNESADATATPDFRIATFRVYADWIQLKVELWEPHDSTSYPSNYMFHTYLYGIHRDMITFGLHNFDIRRDNGNDGHFEETLAEGTVVWLDSKTASVVFDKAIMPDFEDKEVWLYSMVSLDRMPDSDRFHIADSLPED